MSYHDEHGEAVTQRPPNVQQLMSWAESSNVAPDLTDDALDKLGQRCVDQYKVDEDSRSEWVDGANKAMDLVGAQREGKNFPFENASNVKYPLLHSAVVQFASRAYPSIVQGPDIVKVRVEGKDPDNTKADRANRVGSYMSYQLLKKTNSWDEDTDKLMHQLPLVGCAFRKIYWQSANNGPSLELVPATDLVVNNSAPSLELAPQVTHKKRLYPHEIKERIRQKLFLEIDISGTPSTDPGSSSKPAQDTLDNPNESHLFLECHCYADLDGDGLDEPWIVTVHEPTSKVVRIVAGYGARQVELTADGQDILRIQREQYFVKYDFAPDPKGGFYSVGLGHALSDISHTTNTIINQMIDSGTLQNAGGGFVGKAFSPKKSTLRFSPGRYHAIDMLGDDIRKSVVNMQHPGPSPVLFQILGLLIDAAKELAGNQEVLTGNVSTNMQPTTLMALIEQGLQQFTAVYKRIYRSLGKEFQRLGALNLDFLKDQEYAQHLDDQEAAAQAMQMGQSIVASDFETHSADVYPVANPNIVTNMQRAAQNQLLLEMSQNPSFEPMLDKMEIMRRILVHANVADVDALIVQQQGPSPGQELQMQGATTEIEHKQAQIRKLEADVAAIQAKIQTDQAKLQLDAAKAQADIAGKGQAQPGQDNLESELKGIDVEAKLDTLEHQRARNEIDIEAAARKAEFDKEQAALALEKSKQELQVGEYRAYALAAQDAIKRQNMTTQDVTDKKE